MILSKNRVIFAEKSTKSTCKNTRPMTPNFNLNKRYDIKYLLFYRTNFILVCSHIYFTNTLVEWNYKNDSNHYNTPDTPFLVCIPMSEYV